MAIRAAQWINTAIVPADKQSLWAGECFLSLMTWVFMLLEYLPLKCFKVTVDDQVFRTGFWMGAFAGPTPKRHMLNTNHKQLAYGIHGKGGHLSFHQRSQRKWGPPLVKKSKDGRFTGVKERLKQSQLLGFLKLEVSSFLVCVDLICGVWGWSPKTFCP